MTFDYTGFIVQATAGRDKGGVFCVMGTAPDGRLLLADGKRRSVRRPKAKKPGHVVVLTHDSGHPAIQKLKQGTALTDRELRRTLRAFRDEMEA